MGRTKKTGTKQAKTKKNNLKKEDYERNSICTRTTDQ